MNSESSSILLHLAPSESEPLRDQIARQLRERVARGELAEGALLPGHRKLAREHRVAPTTVEAAYELLVDEGFLDKEAGDRMRVAKLSSERLQGLREQLQFEQLLAQELGRRELEMARDVQRRLLPPPEVDGPGWRLVARCQPARVVAGDFYDVIRHGDGRVDVVIADVAGKGFAASLLMASVKAMLPFVTVEGTVADSLTDLNRRLAKEFGRGEFVALALARFDPSRKKLEWANAGAPDPYLLCRDHSPRALSVPGPRLPLGIRDDVRYLAQSAELHPGEGLLLLTDGMPEALDVAGEPLGYENLESCLARHPMDDQPAAWLDRLFESIHEGSGRTPDDDWTAALLQPLQREDVG